MATPTAHPAPEFAAFVQHFPPLDLGDPAKVRAGFASMPVPPLPTGPGFTLDEVQIPSPEGHSIRARLVRPSTEGPFATLVYAHGGGFIVGAPEGDLSWQTVLAGHGIATVGVDYRLSPETKYPGPVADVLAAWEWVQTTGSTHALNPSRVVLGGSSAGGCLAALTSLALQKKTDSKQPDLVLLSFPAVDDRLELYDTTKDGDANAKYYILPAIAIKQALDHFGAPGSVLPGQQPSSALAGLPPHRILVAELDSCAGPALVYADNLKEAGVTTDVNLYRGAPHDFLSFQPDSKASAQAVKDIVAALKGAWA